MSPVPGSRPAFGRDSAGIRDQWKCRAQWRQSCSPKSLYKVYRSTGQVVQEGPGPGGMAKLPWSPSSDPMSGPPSPDLPQGPWLSLCRLCKGRVVILDLVPLRQCLPPFVSGPRREAPVHFVGKHHRTLSGLQVWEKLGHGEIHPFHTSITSGTPEASLLWDLSGTI